MRNKEVNMLTGSITRGVFSLSLPIMIMNVLQSIFSIVDMAVLKNFDITGTAVGAVGACASLITLITGLLIGISAGANVTVAKLIGAGNKEATQRAVGASMALSLAGGIALMAVGISFAEVFLRWMNCPASLLDQSVLYFRLYFAGAPILMLYNFSAAILRAYGDSRSPMMYLILGGVVKLILNYVCVAYLHLSVTGVAISTIVSWSVSAGLCVRLLLNPRGKIALGLSRVRFFKQELKDILRVGIPAGLQQGLYAIANVIIFTTVNTFGPDATTGISVANNIDGILYQISTAPALAVMPFVSQNIGAGNIKRAEKSVGRGVLIAVALGGTIGVLFAVFSRQLSSIMTDSEAAIAFARQKTIIISSTYFICGINEILGSALRGMGKPTVATAATLIFMCAIRFVWVYLVFPLCPNLTFLFLIWPIGWVLSITMLLLFYFPTMKALHKNHEPANHT